MVLNKSKWDKKAKIKYLKKHGLLQPVQEPVVRPKWSSKKQTTQSRIVLQDSDDEEWDSEEDDAFINDFYPQLGETELSKEQKQKVKQQILADLAQKQEQPNESKEQQDGEASGIYLGSEESKQKDMDVKEDLKEEEDKPKLDEFITKDPTRAKPRKLLKAKISDNLLEEYGLSSYKDTVKNKDDYNDIYSRKQKERTLDKIRPDELNGFVIGKSVLGEKPSNNKQHIKQLSEEEKKLDAERTAKARQNELYNQMRRTFNPENSTKSKGKVLEINNINVHDRQQLDALNAKIIAHHDDDQIGDEDFERDIDQLLGTPSNSNSNSNPNNVEDTPLEVSLDDLMNDLQLKNGDKSTSTNPQPKSHPHNSDQDFLDDILG